LIFCLSIITLSLTLLCFYVPIFLFYLFRLTFSRRMKTRQFSIVRSLWFSEVKNLLKFLKKQKGCKFKKIKKRNCSFRMKIPSKMQYFLSCNNKFKPSKKMRNNLKTAITFF
jgi:hypothetical protein